MFEMFVRVLDHDDDRIHHRADGDGDAAQRHDVRADALAEHDEERNQHRDGQNDDGHQCAAQVQQKREAHQRDNETFFQQLFLERPDRAANQRAAVINHRVFHVRRQRLHRLVQPLFHVLNDPVGIRAVTHDDDAADGFAFAVQLGDAAPHVGAELHRRDVAQQNGHAVRATAHGDLPQIVQALHVTLDGQDEFAFGQFERASAHLAVAAFDGHAHVLQRQVVGAQLGRVHGHLVLLHETADGRDLRNARHGGELIFEIPVLIRTQRGKVAVG